MPAWFCSAGSAGSAGSGKDLHVEVNGECKCNGEDQIKREDYMLGVFIYATATAWSCKNFPLPLLYAARDLSEVLDVRTMGIASRLCSTLLIQGVSDAWYTECYFLQ